jgi:hypothetical protein
MNTCSARPDRRTPLAAGAKKRPPRRRWGPRHPPSSHRRAAARHRRSRGAHPPGAQLVAHPTPATGPQATSRMLPRGHPSGQPLRVHQSPGRPVHPPRSRSRVPWRAVRHSPAAAIGRPLGAVGKGRIRIPPSLIRDGRGMPARPAVAGPLVLPSGMRPRYRLCQIGVRSQIARVF